MPRRVLFFGIFDIDGGYPRARSLKAGLAEHGIDVQLMRTDALPVRGERQKLVRSIHRWPGAFFKLLGARSKLRSELRALLRRESFDAVIVPYPGWFALPWLRGIWDGPILLDLFLSLYDTAVYDRAIFREGSLPARMLERLDRRACERADLVLLDTPEHATFVSELTNIDRSRFDFVPIGDPDAPKEALPFPAFDPGERLPALYCGTGVPLHGLDTLLPAVARCKRSRLSVLGGTPQFRKDVATLGDDRARLLAEWASGDELRDVFAQHWLHVGIFGESDKAQRVVPFKVVHALACGRPVVTGDTSSVNTLLSPGSDCFTVPTGDVVALARVLDGAPESERILRMIGQRARRSYDRMFSPWAIGRRLLIQLEQLTGETWLAQDTPVIRPDDQLSSSSGVEASTADAELLSTRA
jgi:glycosyltransferase involved in cell wall biosynthesis